MTTKERIELLPCGACEEIDCDGCLHLKDAKDLYKKIKEETIDELVNRLKLEEFSAHGLSIINKCAKELKEQE